MPVHLCSISGEPPEWPLFQKWHVLFTNELVEVAHTRGPFPDIRRCVMCPAPQECEEKRGGVGLGISRGDTWTVSPAQSHERGHVPSDSTA